MRITNRWLILAILTSTLFLIVIDMTVLYTALPRLTQALNATASEKLWIINVYPLITAALLPGAGMLSDRLGHKLMFMTGLPVFGIASLCAAWSPTAGLLITARIFLALGATMMMPATLAIVRQVFTHESERALAIGIWSSVASAAAALGPVFGGMLLEYFWWGSVFLINVPVVLLVIVCASVFIPHDAGNANRPCDPLSSVQIMLGLVGTIYALKELCKIDTSLTAAAGSLLAGILFLTLFVRRQKRLPYPMIDFSLFRNRLFAGGISVAIVTMIALTGIELVLTQRLQLTLGLTPLLAGLAILPIPLGSALASPFAGVLLPRWGTARLMFFGLSGTAFGIAGLALLVNYGLVLQLTTLFLTGLGLGVAFTAASTSIMLNAPEEKAGMAAAIEDVSWEVGGVLGVTLLGGLMNAIYSGSLILPEGLISDNSAYDSLDEALRLARGMARESADQLLGLAHAAFAHAYLMVIICAALLVTFSAIVVKYALPQTGNNPDDGQKADKISISTL